MRVRTMWAAPPHTSDDASIPGILVLLTLVLFLPGGGADGGFAVAEGIVRDADAGADVVPGGGDDAAADAVITRDPDTGYLNVGTYRMMLQGKRQTS